MDFEAAIVRNSRGVIVKPHFYRLVIGALAAWRLTHLLYGEDGPGNLLVRLRCLAGQGFWGELMDCFYCLSFWIALPLGFALGETWTERLLLVPALSGAGILLQRLSSRAESRQRVIVNEDDRESICVAAEIEHN